MAHDIRDRIVGFRRVPARDLVPHAKNWREHTDEQRAVLDALLRSIGFAGAILTREDEAGRLVVIDGHLRRNTVPDMPVPVLVTDLTEQEAATVLASFDEVGKLAETNKGALDALLRELPAGEAVLDAFFAELAQREGLVPEDAPAGGEGGGGAGSGPGLGTPVIAYDLIFDDEAQQTRWFAMLQRLRRQFPEDATVAARLDRLVRSLLDGDVIDLEP